MTVEVDPAYLAGGPVNMSELGPGLLYSPLWKPPRSIAYVVRGCVRLVGGPLRGPSNDASYAPTISGLTLRSILHSFQKFQGVS